MRWMMMLHVMVLVLLHPVALAQSEEQKVTIGSNGDDLLSTQRSSVYSTSAVFQVTPVQGNSVGFTVATLFSSLPIARNRVHDVSVIPIVNITFNEDIRLSLSVEHPSQTPMLILTPSDGQKDVMCRSQKRLTMINEKITFQLRYSHESNMLSLLLFIRNALVNKCTYQADSTSVFAFSEEPYQITMINMFKTLEIGVAKGIQYSPRVLTFTEIVHQNNFHWFKNYLNQKITRQVHANNNRARELFISDHVRNYLHGRKSAETAYSIECFEGNNRKELDTCGTDSDVRIVKLFFPIHVEDEATTVPVLSASHGLCHPFETLNSNMFFSHLDQDEYKTQSSSQQCTNDNRMHGTADMETSMLLLLTPYWYLDRDSAPAPEWTALNTKLNRNVNGRLDVFSTDLSRSFRVTHLLESLCGLSATIKHANSCKHCSSYAISVNVVLILSPLDHLLIQSNSIFELFKQQNNHINIKIEIIDQPACGGENDLDCVFIETNPSNQENRNQYEQVRLRSPDGIDVLKSINNVVKAESNVRVSSSYISILATHVQVANNFDDCTGNWILDSIATFSSSIEKVSILGSKILLLEGGKILNYGYEFSSHPYVGGLETLLIPRDRYRGYWGNDKRTRMSLREGSISELTQFIHQPLAVPISMVVIDQELWNILDGLEESYDWPSISFIDFCLRASFQNKSSSLPKLGVIKLLTPNELDARMPVKTFGVSMLPVFSHELRELEPNIKWYSPNRLSSDELSSLKLFTERWLSIHNKYTSKMRFVHYQSAVGRKVEDEVEIILNDLKLAWIIHCGGSQGFEASTILQQLHNMVNVRTIVRGYRYCEHSDTISEMPLFFQDIFDTSAHKSFVELYRNPKTGNANPQIFDKPSGEIALYARDYREIGRWIPDDADYVIGRYMYEVDRIPQPWAYHCNLLDEVWVPSNWQKSTFTSSGVVPDIIEIMHETVDSNLFDADSVAALRLPGSTLDGYDKEDTNRPFAFCSVFKMENRKGWKELVSAYISEYFFDQDDVTLVLRTYRHTGHGISANDFSRTILYAEIDKVINETVFEIFDRLNLEQPPNFNTLNLPPIDLVSEHLSSSELVEFYKSCDAFVLPTHGEGWGLPTHEAMAMGLPVITTDWGGSTEFISSHDNADIALRIRVDALESANGDAWLENHSWAKIDISELRGKMRILSDDREFSKQLGLRGRNHVLENFSQEKVALQYSNRLIEIYRKMNSRKVCSTSLIRDTARLRQSDVSTMSLTSSLQQDHKQCIRGISPGVTDSLVGSIMPRGSIVAAASGSDYQMTETFQTCRVFGPIHNRRKFRKEQRQSSINFDLRMKDKDWIKDSDACDIAIMTTWEPRKCGIATYSAALRNGLLSICPPGKSRVDIIAAKHREELNDIFNASIVKGTIRDLIFQDMLQAGRLINQRKYKTVFVQFEFGMLYGDALMCMLRSLTIPNIIVTQHTINPVMLEAQHSLSRELYYLADRTIVMTEAMRHTMNAFHAMSTNRVAVIPHGIDDVNEEVLSGERIPLLKQLYPNTTIIISNGLLHPKKGIEFMIRAMPAILQRHRNVMYFIYGTPHPGGGGDTIRYYEILKNESSYVDNVGFGGHIVFNETYLSTDDLLEVMRSCDIYVNAYIDREQAVSGTLSMAIGAGAVSVSTPYPHALELLRDGVGVFVPFEDYDAISRAIVNLLDNPNRMKLHRAGSVALARKLSWKKVAMSHLELIRDISLNP